MIADAIPPYATVLFIFGALLTLLAFAGQITIREARVGIDKITLRFLAGIVGGCLIVGSLWLGEPARLSTENSNKETPSRLQSPALKVSNVPVERYADLKGKWVIAERVRKEDGGYEIIWSYDATILGNVLTMQGRKTSINDKKPTKSEEAAVSVYAVALNGLHGEGTANEKNSRGEILRTTLTIDLAENFMSFSGSLRSGATEVSKITANKQ
jgi:hypothetical protein